MISYEPLLKTLTRKRMDVYALEKMLDNYTLKSILNANRFISTQTIDKICSALECKVSDVIEYKEGEQTKGEILEKKVYVDFDFNKLKEIVEGKGGTLPKLSKAMGHQRTYLNSMMRYKRIGKYQASKILAALNDEYMLKLTLKDLEPLQSELCPF